MKERTASEVSIGKVNGITLNSVVKYCYTGCIDINDTNITELLAASTMMQFKAVEEKCIEFLKQQLQSNPINCLKLYSVADTYSFLRLKEQSIQTASEHFSIISKIDDFMQLDVELLKEILASDNISVAEEEVFEAAMTWIEYDEANRKKFIEEILTTVRLTQVDSKVSCVWSAIWFSPILLTFEYFL